MIVREGGQTHRKIGMGTRDSEQCCFEKPFPTDRPAKASSMRPVLFRSTMLSHTTTTWPLVRGISHISELCDVDAVSVSHCRLILDRCLNKVTENGACCFTARAPPCEHDIANPCVSVLLRLRPGPSCSDPSLTTSVAGGGKSAVTRK